MIHRLEMIACHVFRLADNGSHEMLQLRRVPEDYLGGTWQIVRGGIEPGETAVQAALRELREEAGLVPQELYRLGLVETFHIPSRDAARDTIWHCATFCAIVAPDAQVKLDHEHDAHRWIPRDQALGHTMWASERAVLRELFHDILDDGPAKPYLRLEL